MRPDTTRSTIAGLAVIAGGFGYFIWVVTILVWDEPPVWFILPGLVLLLLSLVGFLTVQMRLSRAGGQAISWRVILIVYGILFVLAVVRVVA